MILILIRKGAGRSVKTEKKLTAPYCEIVQICFSHKLKIAQNVPRTTEIFSYFGKRTELRRLRSFFVRCLALLDFAFDTFTGDFETFPV
jgi:hypothetical protein